MSIVNRGPGPFPHLARDAMKHWALASDLERIARGEHPGPDDLRDAPVLFEWRVIIAPIPHLVGVVLGHPKIADGRMCRTSALITINPDIGYARTFSRFYRLEARPPPCGAAGLDTGSALH